MIVEYSTNKTLMAGFADSSCILEFTEIVPMDSGCSDYYISECIRPVALLTHEDMQDLNVKLETTDRNDNDTQHYFVKEELASECNADLPCYDVKVRF